MKQDILVSIIIPIYNVEEYLDKCIISVLSQSYRNIEILLINDGSTDNSKLICEKYKKKDRRISIINTVNRGVSHARNIGIKCSKGKYLLFIDSDDDIEITYVEKLLISILESNSDLSFCYSKFIYSEKEKVDLFGLENIKVLTKNIKNDFALLEFVFYRIWGILYKADIIKNNNIFFKEFLLIAEDHIFNYEYLKYSKVYNFVDEYLYNYYIRKKISLSKYKNCKTFEDELYNLKQKKEFLLKFLDDKVLIKESIDRYVSMLMRKYSDINGLNINDFINMKILLIKIKEIYDVKCSIKYILSKKVSNKKDYIISFLVNKNMYFIIFFIAFLKYLKRRMKYD